jgi:hypothetical protein
MDAKHSISSSVATPAQGARPRAATIDPRQATIARLGAADVALYVAIVAMTLTTAAIHAYLGGLLFLANAAGYSTLAIAMVVPITIARRYRWLVRLALLGFTFATIAGWIAFGARFPLAYLDKGIEAILVACLVTETYRLDGGPLEVVRRLAQLARSTIGRVTGRMTAA